MFKMRDFLGASSANFGQLPDAVPQSAGNSYDQDQQQQQPGDQDDVFGPTVENTVGPRKINQSPFGLFSK